MNRYRPDVTRSLRRSYIRRSVLRVLHKRGGAYVAEIARWIVVEERAVSSAVYGSRPRYREELSLLSLGLVRIVVTPIGQLVEITDLGRLACIRGWARPLLR